MSFCVLDFFQGPFPASFSLVSSFLDCNRPIITFEDVIADVGIPTADRWCRKRLLCQMRHNHGPLCWTLHLLVGDRFGTALLPLSCIDKSNACQLPSSLPAKYCLGSVLLNLSVQTGIDAILSVSLCRMSKSTLSGNNHT